MAGISAAVKTRAVSDYLRNLGVYLKEGSLYAAIEEIDALIAAGIPSSVEPFVTSEKLTVTKDKIKSYLGIA